MHNSGSDNSSVDNSGPQKGVIVEWEVGGSGNHFAPNQSPRAND